MAESTTVHRRPTETVAVAQQPSPGELWSWTLFTLAALWLLGALLAPVAAARGSAAAPFLYLFYGPICHQLPERSFHWLGFQTGACHRCVGLYSGFLLGLVVMPHWRALREQLVSRPWWIVFFALPLLIDVSLRETNVPASRFATGAVAALPLALLAQLAARQLRQRNRSRSSSGTDAREQKPGKGKR